MDELVGKRDLHFAAAEAMVDSSLECQSAGRKGKGERTIYVDAEDMESFL